MTSPKVSIPKNRIELLIFADFETYLQLDGAEVWNHKEDENFTNILANQSQVIPWLLCAQVPKIRVHESKGASIIKDEYENFWSLYPHEKFFKLVKQYWDLGYLPNIYFHNAAYDLTAGIETAFKELDPECNVYFKAKGNNKAFLKGEMESNKYGFKCIFGDTLLYKNISLKLVGEMFGSPKGEIPYCMADLWLSNGIVNYIDWMTGKPGAVSLQACLEYALQDTRLLKQYYFYLQYEKDVITTTINGNPAKSVRALTQGGHARSLLDLWLHKHRNGNFVNCFKFPISEEEGKLQQRSLSGAFTSRNKNITTYKCKDNECITSFDCNSMYPYIMTLGIPWKEWQLKPNYTLNKEWIEWVRITPLNVQWKGVMSILTTPPIPNEKQSVTEEDNLDIYIFRELLEFIKLHSTGEIIEHESYWQEKTYTAQSFIKFLYSLRLDKKEEIKIIQDKLKTNKADQELTQQLTALKLQEQGVKLVMNSLYGKFAERTYLCDKYYFGGQYITVPKTNQQYGAVSSGLYIALYGRYILYQKILATLNKGFTFLYCDTDSVKFAYPLNRKNELEDVFGFNAGHLGDWKNEGSWHEFHNPEANKKYALINVDDPSETTFALSGIDNKFANALSNLIIEDPNKGHDYLRIIFDSKHSILFHQAKNRKVITAEYQQTIIAAVNVLSHRIKGVKKTGDCWLNDNGNIELTLLNDK